MGMGMGLGGASAARRHGGVGGAWGEGRKTRWRRR